MGLGGWMLQEGYMLQLGEIGQQHRIRARLVELVGKKRTADFYRAWLDNHTTEADIAAMAPWGVNSGGLPIPRSDKGGVGQECVSTCRSRVSLYIYKQNTV